jgi:hypothetical protein
MRLGARSKTGSSLSSTDPDPTPRLRKIWGPGAYWKGKESGGEQIGAMLGRTGVGIGRWQTAVGWWQAVTYLWLTVDRDPTSS